MPQRQGEQRQSRVRRCRPKAPPRSHRQRRRPPGWWQRTPAEDGSQRAGCTGHCGCASSTKRRPQQATQQRRVGVPHVWIPKLLRPGHVQSVRLPSAVERRVQAATSTRRSPSREAGAREAGAQQRGIPQRRKSQRTFLARLALTQPCEPRQQKACEPRQPQPAASGTCPSHCGRQQAEGRRSYPGA